MSAAVESWPRHGLERVESCPVCDSSQRRLELEALQDTTFGVAPGRWTLYRCETCGSGYLDPRPDEHSIGLAYADYYTHRTESLRAAPFTRLRRAVSNAYRNHVFGGSLRPALAGAWVVAACTPARARMVRMDGRGLERLRERPGMLLDVGSGNGDFLAFAQQLGWRAFGVELDPSARAVACRRGLQIAGRTLSELGPEFDGTFDAVSLSHVIEHVHAPTGLLRDCRRVMKPGAQLWVETPNIDSVGFEIYGRHWRGLEPPRHLSLFNPSSLRRALELAGFTGIDILPPRDVAAHLFALSAEAAAGHIAEADTTPPSAELLRAVRRAARRARAIVARDPDRSEFVTAIALRG